MRSHNRVETKIIRANGDTVYALWWGVRQLSVVSRDRKLWLDVSRDKHVIVFCVENAITTAQRMCELLIDETK